VWQAVTCVCLCVWCVWCVKMKCVAEALRTQSPNHDALAEVGYHARVSERAGNTLRERRSDEHAHALGSVAVGAGLGGSGRDGGRDEHRADVPTCRADSAGASSMI
jgi:hypothetical protein